QTQSATPNGAVQNFDQYLIALLPGQTVTVSTCPTGVAGANGTGDTILRLLDPQGNEVAVNDDANGACGLLSTLTFTAAWKGTYSVRAGCFDSTACSGLVAYKIVFKGLPVRVSAKPMLHIVSLLRDAEGRIEDVVSNRAYESWEYGYSPDGFHQLTSARNVY